MLFQDNDKTKGCLLLLVMFIRRTAVVLTIAANDLHTLWFFSAALSLPVIRVHVFSLRRTLTRDSEVLRPQAVHDVVQEEALLR